MDQHAERKADRRAATRTLDRLVLPAVTFLLLLGAVFVALAWVGAREATSSSQRKDERRAERNADAIAAIVQQRWTALERWQRANAAALEPADAARLQPLVEQAVSGGSSASTLAWVIVDPRGTARAVAVSSNAPPAAAGILDDMRALGRRASARQQRLASGALRAGDQVAFAVAIPITVTAASTPRSASGSAGPERATGAIVSANLAASSSLGAFLPSTSPRALDALTLGDSRGRIIAGSEGLHGDDLVMRQVGTTGWHVTFAREHPDELLPSWAYPGFALLLVALAVGYAFQDLSRRRLSSAGEQGRQQLRTLYDLAAGVLHARTVREQAEQLAHASRDLVTIDGARVRIAAEHDFAGIVAGTATSGQREYRVALTGPRSPLGELIAYRAHGEFTAEDRSVLQTAATLVGAAMHTVESLESERAAAAELQRLDELRSNLLATVAHELRSPMTAVKGVLGLLAMQDDLTARTRQYVEVATERTDRLVDLIQDLFDTSLLETGQLDIRPERRPAAELLDAALAAQAAAHPDELILSATPNLMVTVDPVRFDQLVNNLVTNAFRHGKPPIEVAVRPATGGVHVIVTDEGPGIPPADRERIFGKFWQGSTGHARLVEGAGLGLSLVQGLVRVHGGTIQIDSVHADGRGARFTVFLPDVVPDDAPGVRARRDSFRDGATDYPDLEPITRII